MKRILFTLIPVLKLGTPLFAQNGVPEPGVIVYGKVFAADGLTTLPASALTVSLYFQQAAGDGQPAVTRTFAGEVGRGENEETFYVAQLEFANLEVIGETATPFNKFVFPTSGQKSFALSGSSNVNSEGVNSPITRTPQPPNFTYPAPNAIGGVDRGKVVRMDLITQLTAPTDTFENYIARYPGLTGDDALPGSDPDGDSMTNEAEWLFKTDPTNTASNRALHRLVVTIASVEGEVDSQRLTFTPMFDDGSRSYQILESTTLSPDSPPQPSGVAITAGGNLGDGAKEGPRNFIGSKRKFLSRFQYAD